MFTTPQSVLYSADLILVHCIQPGHPASGYKRCVSFNTLITVRVLLNQHACDDISCWCESFLLVPSAGQSFHLISWRYVSAAWTWSVQLIHIISWGSVWSWCSKVRVTAALRYHSTRKLHFMLYFFLHGSLYLFSSHTLTCDVNLWNTLCLSSPSVSSCHWSGRCWIPSQGVVQQIRLRESLPFNLCLRNCIFIQARHQWEINAEPWFNTGSMLVLSIWMNSIYRENGLQRVPVCVALRFDSGGEGGDTEHLTLQSCNRWSTLHTMYCLFMGWLKILHIKVNKHILSFCQWLPEWHISLL